MEESRNWITELKRERGMSYRVNHHRPIRVTWQNLGEIYHEDIVDSIEKHTAFLDAFETSGLEELELLRSVPENKLTAGQRQRMEELYDDLGLYPGALNFRNKKELGNLTGERLPFEPAEVMRLHLELVGDLDESEVEILKRYGGTENGVISRDLIVPATIPLYALNYAIQRAFGWQNSHLHQFKLETQRLHELLEGRSEQWIKMVGIMFRCPLMDTDAQYYADDYEGGRISNWFRDKYTGPYRFRRIEEELFSCLEDMEDIRPETEMHVEYFKEPGGHQFMDFVAWKKDGIPLNWPGEKIETVKFKDCPLDALPRVFESDPFALLEHLPLNSVLCPGFDLLPCDMEAQFLEENHCKTVSEELEFIGDKMEDARCSIVLPQPFTTELLYKYDFGDDWNVRITASWNCIDLVEKDILDQSTLDKANIWCRETYRPVLIAAEGPMVMDDVGGLSGFVNFLSEINPDLTDMDPQERADARQQKKEMLEWAKMQGWKRADSMNGFVDL